MTLPFEWDIALQITAFLMGLVMIGALGVVVLEAIAWGVIRTRKKQLNKEVRHERNII